MKQQLKNNDNNNDTLVKDLQEIKLTIEIMKRQIAELEKKHSDKDEIQKLALADARELFEMRNNR